MSTSSLWRRHVETPSLLHGSWKRMASLTLGKSRAISDPSSMEVAALYLSPMVSDELQSGHPPQTNSIAVRHCFSTLQIRSLLDCCSGYALHRSQGKFDCWNFAGIRLAIRRPSSLSRRLHWLFICRISTFPTSKRPFRLLFAYLSFRPSWKKSSAAAPAVAPADFWSSPLRWMIYFPSFGVRILLISGRLSCLAIWMKRAYRSSWTFYSRQIS